MWEALFNQLADHWVLSTYLSVMAVNEGAILAAFSLASDSGRAHLCILALVSAAGALTNDLILYVIARYGAERFLKPASADDLKSASFFERFFLGNVFLALLFIKFLFGIRLFLTMYLVAKKRIPLGTFIAYDILGILLYVAVIGGIGLLVGRGNESAETTYQVIVRTVTAVSLLTLVAHLTGRFLKKNS